MKNPNILFIMADQFSYNALGCINSQVKTPNLDKLAKRGVLFGQAVCQAPISVPSRYSLMTGLYPSQTAVRHNTAMYLDDIDMPAKTIPQYLESIGYETCGIGKTHWIAEKPKNHEVVNISKRDFGLRYGYDGHFNLYGRDSVVKFEKSDMQSEVEELRLHFGRGGEVLKGYEGVSSLYDEEHFYEHWLADKAIDYLETYHKEQRETPFFLYVSFDYPHPPFVVPKGYESLYNLGDIPDMTVRDSVQKLYSHATLQHDLTDDFKQKSPSERKQVRMRYWALCSYIDALCGKILDTLHQIKEDDNTLIIFTSDHGDMMGSRNYRFSKYCLYEESIRVPLIIAGTPLLKNKQGFIDNQPAELIDLLPTILDATSYGPVETLPGCNLLSSKRKSGSFAEYHGSGYELLQQSPTYMWRNKEWKLILHIPEISRNGFEHMSSYQGELYHLENDPEEYNNLYYDDAYRTRREDMTRDCLLHMMVAYARYPKPSHNYQHFIE